MPETAALDANDVEHLIGEAFLASPADGPARDDFHLVLVSVTSRPAPAGFRAPFTLEFLGPPSPVYPQGTYRLAHVDLGELELFVVPVGASARGISYEVVFG